MERNSESFSIDEETEEEGQGAEREPHRGSPDTSAGRSGQAAPVLSCLVDVLVALGALAAGMER
jgi:hypothetical protein